MAIGTCFSSPLRINTNTTWILTNSAGSIPVMILISKSRPLVLIFRSVQEIAVLIAVAVGFYYVFQEAKKSESDLDQFKSFLRNLLMHGAVGTALGGVSTIVGEPQNLLIGSIAGWNFLEFFIQMLPISFPVFIFGIFTCYIIEKFKTYPTL